LGDDEAQHYIHMMGETANRSLWGSTSITGC
jgi:hypothetical protein